MKDIERRVLRARRAAIKHEMYTNNFSSDLYGRTSNHFEDCEPRLSKVESSQYAL